MYFSSLSCCGCTWILQQVCCLVFFLVEYFFRQHSLEAYCKSVIVYRTPCHFFFVISFSDVELWRGNAVVLSSLTGHAWLHSPSSPPSHVCLFPRISALSLHSMCPCPVPDAEAHGKDSNNRPEQLYLSNGELVSVFLPMCAGFICSLSCRPSRAWLELLLVHSYFLQLCFLILLW